MTEEHADWVIHVGFDEETVACPGCGTSIAVRFQFVSAEKIRELERTSAEWSKGIEKELDRDLGETE